MATKQHEDKTPILNNKPTDAQTALKESKLNQAALDLLLQLPDHAGQLVQSLAKQYQMPLWQYISGILLAVHLEGRLSEFRIDPAWREGFKTKTLKCKHCNKDFVPRHINQPFCSNECGLSATARPTRKPSTLRVMPDDPVHTLRNSASTNNSASNTWSKTADLAA